MAMTEREEKLLYALAWMAHQYLLTYDGNRTTNLDEPIDSMAMSAGEGAILALVDHGLMEDVSQNRVMGRWTEAGKKFLLSKHQPAAAQAAGTEQSSVASPHTTWKESSPQPNLRKIMQGERTRNFAMQLMDEVWMPLDHAAVSRFYHPDVVGHHRAQVLTIKDVVARLKWDRLNFRDPTYDIKDIVADTNAFAIRFLYSCTLIATGQRFTSEVNYFYRLRNGKISEFWLLSDSDFDYKQRL